MWVGWVTPDYHQHDMSFDLSKVRAVTVTMGDEQGNVHSRCWGTVGGGLCAGGRLAWVGWRLQPPALGLPENLLEQEESRHPLQKLFFSVNVHCSLIVCSAFFYAPFSNILSLFIFPSISSGSHF